MYCFCWNTVWKYIKGTLWAFCFVLSKNKLENSLENANVGPIFVLIWKLSLPVLPPPVIQSSPCEQVPLVQLCNNDRSSLGCFSLSLPLDSVRIRTSHRFFHPAQRLQADKARWIFRGFERKIEEEKKEKNPANSNLCNTQLHIQSGRSVKPPLPTAGHCHWSRAHTGGQTLVSYHSSVCLPAVTGVNTE